MVRQSEDSSQSEDWFRSEDYPEVHAAVKKGHRALEKSFRDHPGFDRDLRVIFPIEKVEFIGGGMCHTITIRAGEDSSSADVTVPNPLWGFEDMLMKLIGIGHVQSFPEMVTRKRLRTKLQFVMRKLSGVVGVIVTRIDYQKLVGKKHVKKNRTRSELEFSGFFDEFGGVFEQFDYLFDDDDHDEFSEEEDEEEEEEDGHQTSSNPGGELASAALDIEDVVVDHAQNMLTISFKRPLRALKDFGSGTGFFVELSGLSLLESGKLGAFYVNFGCTLPVLSSPGAGKTRPNRGGWGLSGCREGWLRKSRAFPTRK